MCEVSVIIPAYNAEKFICETVASAVAHERAAPEIIVVNDGSTDQTEAALRPYFERIVYLRQHNQGVSAARNSGKARASGRWLLFLDADDVLAPQALDILLAVARKDEHAVVYGDVSCLNMTNGHRRLRSVPRFAGISPHPASAFFTHGGHPPSSFLLPAALAREVGGFDQRFSYAADLHFLMRCGSLAPFIHVPEVVLTYREHGDSMSRKAASAILDVISARIAFQEWCGSRGFHFLPCQLSELQLFEQFAQLYFYRREWHYLDITLKLARDQGHASPALRRFGRMRCFPPLLYSLRDLYDRAQRSIFKQRNAIPESPLHTLDGTQIV
jgi:glycosyltransferase involved in cell wall biosynthesis